VKHYLPSASKSIPNCFVLIEKLLLFQMERYERVQFPFLSILGNNIGMGGIHPDLYNTALK